VLPKSLVGLAIAYALRHWQALQRFATDGFLDIDNNIAERALRDRSKSPLSGPSFGWTISEGRLVA
jgi:hypothetical protein